MLDKNIFNVNKTNYLNTPLFLGEEGGLLDTINRPHTEILRLYKLLKANDWDELEFDFTPCNAEFKMVPKDISDSMVFSLAWQWEADTMASRTISAVTAPFVSYTDLATAWQRVAENESLHGYTYSEIVKQSFDDPDAAIKMILDVNQATERSEMVAKVMADTFYVGHKLALGELPKDQATYNQIFKFCVAVWCLERIQFMSSFSVTFALGQSKYFVPIAKAVQKILKDEWEIHVPLMKTVLDIELQTERGLMALYQCRDEIKQIIDEVIMQEVRWTKFMFNGDRHIPLLTEKRSIRWVLFMAKPIYDFFGFKWSELPVGIDVDEEEVRENPLPWMKEWMNIDLIQGAAQEEKGGAYLLGMITQDLGKKPFITEGL